MVKYSGIRIWRVVMAIPMKPFKDFATSGVELLAAIIQKQGSITGRDEEEKRRPVSFRMDNDLHDKIDKLAEAAHLTKTEVFEMLLWDGIRRVEEQMRLNEEFYDLPDTQKE
jgi:hypothetical protein